MAFDLSRIGALLQLTQEVDLDRIIVLSEKVDLGRLLKVISEMDDGAVIKLADMIQAGKFNDVAAVATVKKEETSAESKTPQPETANKTFRTVAVISNRSSGRNIASNLSNAGLWVFHLQYSPSRNSILDDSTQSIVNGDTPSDTFLSEAASDRFFSGDLDDHIETIEHVDWIIEDVDETLEKKRELMDRLCFTIQSHSVFTSTTGPTKELLSEITMDTCGQRFFGIRFDDSAGSNGTLEVLPLPQTDRNVVERVRWFGRIGLGREVRVDYSMTTGGDIEIEDNPASDGFSETNQDTDIDFGDTICLSQVKENPGNTLWKNKSAALLNLGDGVVLFEFRSRANTLSGQLIEGLSEVLDRVEADRSISGLVIGNEGPDFSMGASLPEIAIAFRRERFDLIEQFTVAFQRINQRIRYAPKPIVVAVHQRVLGGACELVMSCRQPVAAAASNIGLIEPSVGLIPAGAGTMRLASIASKRTPNRDADEIQRWIEKLFLNVFSARVSKSAEQAQEMLYLPAFTRIVMHPDRLLYTAKEEVLHLSRLGYLPHSARNKILAVGTPGRVLLENQLQQMCEDGTISEYDRYLGSRLAYVITGGDLNSVQDVHEEYLLELESEVFLELMAHQKTQDRIYHMLRNNERLLN